MNIIEYYHVVLSQMANLDNSEIIFCKAITLLLQEEICSILNIKISPNPSKYLSLPTLIGRSKMQLFQNLEDKVSQKVGGWKESPLLQAGTKILLMLVILAILGYAMACFFFPKKCCQGIDKRKRVLWWIDRKMNGKFIR